MCIKLGRGIEGCFSFVGLKEVRFDFFMKTCD